MIKVGLSSSADLNVSLSGGAADVGVTYEAVGGKFTVNASGVITPIKAGVGLVVVKNSSTNQVLKKIAVAVVPDAELANFQNIQSTATSVVSSSGNSGQSGSSSTFVDQEVVTFENDGSYVLANASSGIEANSVPMLMIDGVVQDGVTATKRFDVVNDASGVKRKIQLYSYETVNNFVKGNSPTITEVSGYNGLAVLNNSNYVRVSSPSLVFGTGDFTVEAWVYTTSWDGYSAFFANEGASYPNLVLGFGQFDSLYAYSGGWIVNHGTTMANYAQNQWQHVAFVRQGSTVKVYVNGVNTATGTTTGNFTSGDWGIGAWYNSGNEAFPGHIRNFRVTKAARYTSNFTPFPVSSLVEQLSDSFDEDTVLKASFNQLTNNQLTWSVGTALLPDAEAKCLISYRA